MFSFFRIFRRNSGGQQQQQQQQNKVGPAARVDIEIDLDSVYTGIKNFTINMQRRKLCPQCKGVGAKDPKDVQTCPDCRGQGVRMLQQGFAFFQMQCQRCEGQGRIFKSVCTKCSGAKMVQEREELKMDIPAGCPEGHRIVLAGKADESPSYEKPGDLHIFVSTKKHPRFVRDGANLYTTMDPLTLQEALLGFTKSIKQLDGTSLPITRAEPTQPNQVLVMRTFGLSKAASGGKSTEKGDLFVTMPVVLPPALTNDQRKAFANVFDILHARKDEL